MDFPPSVCHELMVEKRLPTHVRAPLTSKPFIVLFMVQFVTSLGPGGFSPRCQCRTSDLWRPSGTVSSALSCLPRSCNSTFYQSFTKSPFVCLLLAFVEGCCGEGWDRTSCSPGWPWTPRPPTSCATTPGLLCSLTQRRKLKLHLPDLQGCRVCAVKDDGKLWKLTV